DRQSVDLLRSPSGGPPKLDDAGCIGEDAADKLQATGAGSFLVLCFDEILVDRFDCKYAGLRKILQVLSGRMLAIGPRIDDYQNTVTQDTQLRTKKVVRNERLLFRH